MLDASGNAVQSHSLAVETECGMCEDGWIYLAFFLPWPVDAPVDRMFLQAFLKREPDGAIRFTTESPFSGPEIQFLKSSESNSDSGAH